MGAMFPISPVLPALTIQQCVVYAAALQIRTRINLHKNGQKNGKFVSCSIYHFSNLIQKRSGSGQKIEAAAENASESSIDLHRFDELMISPLRLINLPRLTTIQRAELPDLTRAIRRLPRQGSKIDFPFGNCMGKTRPGLGFKWSLNVENIHLKHCN